MWRDWRAGVAGSLFEYAGVVRARPSGALYGMDAAFVVRVLEGKQPVKVVLGPGAREFSLFVQEHDVASSANV